MKKRIYTAAGLFLAAALVLGGCGKEKVPESEFATADEAKEALTSAETIEIYFDLYGSKRKTKIVADGKVAGYLQKNLYCAVFKTETDGARQIDFMDRMAMLWRLERDYRSIDDNPVNTGVQIYETVAVVFVLILLIGSSFSKWRQKKKN